ncbi:MAG: hypothetical protein QGH74_04005 [Candidatus Brocadiia bacterium]|nr:hypothetical protein [Candidatus Brocadiia bacterium]
MRGKLLLCVFAVLALAVTVNAQEGSRRAPQLPPGVWACVEVADFRGFQDGLEAFVGAVSDEPVPPMPSGALLAAIPNSSMVDVDKPVRIIGVLNEGGVPAAVSVFSVPDVDLYLLALGQQWEKESEEGGLTLFVEEGQAFDNEAFAAASPEERMDFSAFMTTVRITHAVGGHYNMVCLGDSEAAVAAALTLLQNGNITDEPLLGRKSGLAVYVQLREPLITMGLEAKAREAVGEWLDSMPMMPGTEAKLEQAKAVLEIEVDGAIALAKQVEGIGMRLTADGEEIRIRARLDAASDTPLAQYLASVPRGLPETMSYLPADGVMALATRVGDLGPHWGTLAEWYSRLLAATMQDAESTGQQAQMMEQWLNDLSDSMAFAMLPEGLLQWIVVYGMKDAEAARSMQDQMAAWFEIANDQYQAMGTPVIAEVSPERTAYGGHEIVEWSISPDMDALDPSDPQALQTIMVLQMFLGEGVKGHMAALGEDFVMAMGRQDSLEALKAVIDGDQETLPDSETFRKALEALPAEPQCVFFLRLPGFVTAVMDVVAGMVLPMGTSTPEFEDGPGIIGSCGVSGTDLGVVIVVPAEEIRVMVAGFAAMAAEMAPPSDGLPPEFEFEFEPMPAP